MATIIQDSWVESDAKALLVHGQTITTEAMELNYYNRFIGSTNRAVIRQGISGDIPLIGATTRMHFRKKLTGAGVEGNSDLSDNIDKALELFQDVEYELFGNSTLSEVNKIKNKLAANASREEEKQALIEWAATKHTKKIDIRFTRDATNIAACTSGAGGIYAENSTESIKPSDKFTTAGAKAIKKMARSGRDASGARVPKIKPFKIVPHTESGIALPVAEYYIAIIGPQQAEDIKNDSFWIEAQEQAAKSGELNNIFTGRLGIYDGVVYYDREGFDDEDSGIITSKNTYAGREITNLDDYNGSGGLETEIGLFLGAQAGLMPQDEGFTYYEKKVDMGRKIQYGIDRGLDFGKAKFIGKTPEQIKSVYHGKDYAMIAIVSPAQQG